ncbi:SurA N-terminal domain-containing protein [Candidatus Bipolaricaulota bacterium]|nr:SurA N-terminal domain-containing protein [Candidatus Bipolaricaulota bacterium]
MIFSKRGLVIASLLLLMVIPVTGVLAQDEGTQQDQPTAVATVNGEQITQQELSQAAQLRQVYMLAMQRQLPQSFTQFLFSSEQGREFIKEYQKQVLDNLIDQKIQSQKVEELGITATDEEVQEAVDQQIQSTIESSDQYENEEDLKKAVESQGDQSYEEAINGLREQLRQSIIRNKLREQVTGGVEVTEDEMKTFYNENKESYKEDGEVKPFEDVKEQINNTLLERKKNEAWAEWLKEARKNADIKKNLEALGM